VRFLLINTDYLDFLTWLYRQHPGLDTQTFEEQVRARADSLFGLADFYSLNLKQLGHEAWDIDINNEFMQRAWDRQYGPGVNGSRRWQVRLRRGFVPWLSRTERDWFYEILRAQIKFYRPDVLLTQTIDIDAAFLREMKLRRLLVGRHLDLFDPQPEMLRQ
jgi:hypothetical protein